MSVLQPGLPSNVPGIVFWAYLRGISNMFKQIWGWFAHQAKQDRIVNFISRKTAVRDRQVRLNQIEPLEPRVLLSSSPVLDFNDGVLTVWGTSSHESIQIIEQAESGDVAVSIAGISGDFNPTTYIPFEQFSGVEQVIVHGGDGDDQITVFSSTEENASHLNVHIFGDDGDDNILGGAGDDFIDGGQGNDRLDGRGGNDNLRGGEGRDTLIGDDGDQLLDENENSIAAPRSPQFIHPNAPALSLENGILTIRGTEADDYVRVSQVGENSVVIKHWAPRDGFGTRLTPGLERQFDGVVQIVIYGGAGDDDIYTNPVDTNPIDMIIHGDDGRDHIAGGSGNDLLYGGEGHDQLFGGDGNDLLDGGLDIDSVRGEAGNDIYITDINTHDLIRDTAGQSVFLAENKESFEKSYVSLSPDDQASLLIRDTDTVKLELDRNNLLSMLTSLEGGTEKAVADLTLTGKYTQELVEVDERSDGSLLAVSPDQTFEPAEYTYDTWAGDPNGTPADSEANRISANAADSPFAAVGTIASFDPQTQQITGVHGTGTLIAENRVITAAHLFDVDTVAGIDANFTGTNPATIWRFVLNAGSDFSHVIPLANGGITVHPDWAHGAGGLGDADDVAVFELAIPVTDVTPMRLLRQEWQVQQFDLVGYGNFGFGTSATVVTQATADTKRTSTNIINTGIGDDESQHSDIEGVRWDFDDPTGGNGVMGGATLGNTIEGGRGLGDSGGPYVINDNGTRLVGAVHSIGYRPAGGSLHPLFGSAGQGASVFPKLNWIEGLAPRDIVVHGGTGLNIEDGDTTPTFADATQFADRGIHLEAITNTFFVRNWGQTDLTITDVEIIGGDTGDFTITAGGGGGTIDPLGEHPFQIRYNPTSLTDSAHTGLLRSAHVRVTSNDPDEPTYTFWVGGNVFDNNIPDSGTTTLTVRGTDGIDAFSFAVNGSGDFDMTLNGDSLTLTPVQTDIIHFIGQNSTDSVTLNGSSSLTDDYDFFPEATSVLTASSYIVRIQDIETSVVNANGGPSQEFAELYDSSGSDAYVSGASQSTLTSSLGISSQVNGFDKVNSYAVDTHLTDGYDTASLTDTTADDHFFSFEGHSELNSASILRYVSGYDRVEGLANQGGSNDFSELYNTSGNDAFVGTATYSDMTSLATSAFPSGLYRIAYGFEKSNTYRTVDVMGKTYTAALHDHTGNDHFKTGQTATSFALGYGELTIAGGPKIWVQDFSVINLYGNNGGTNTIDTSGSHSYALNQFGSWI